MTPKAPATRRTARRLLVALASAVGIVAGTAAGPVAAVGGRVETSVRSVPSSGSPVLLFRLQDPRIAESSGLAVSAYSRSVVWTHNDSGDSSRLFAVDAAGRTIGVHPVNAAAARDWEALAPTRDARGRPALLVGDIGDNTASRTRGILLHLVPEPRNPRSSTTLPATSYRVRYPDGPHDAEALAVDPKSHAVIVVTKALFGGSIYRARSLNATGATVLQKVGPAPALVTDAAFLPDGRLVLRTYGDAVILGDDFQEVSHVPVPDQPQGESIAALPTGDAVLVGSEGEHSEVWRVPVPGASAASEASSPAVTPPRGAATTDGTAAASGGHASMRPPAATDEARSVTDRLSRKWPFLVVAVGGVALIAGALLAARRRGK